MARQTKLRPEDISVPLNVVCLAAPFAVAYIFSVAFGTTWDLSRDAFYSLLPKLKLFWPALIGCAAVTAKLSRSPKGQVASQCLLVGSVVAATGFYFYAADRVSASLISN